MGPRLVKVRYRFQLALLYFLATDYCSEGVTPKEQRGAGRGRAQGNLKEVMGVIYFSFACIFQFRLILKLEPAHRRFQCFLLLS